MPRAWQLWALETPDEKWSTAARIVTEIAGGYGFDNLITGVDQLGHHQILLSDRHGSELRLGSGSTRHCRMDRLPPGARTSCATLNTEQRVTVPHQIRSA
ncbi:LppA family lipoprotein [Alloactinosynnema sp. L-07]|uniref:LppA family lipoprotein n=1 Tax=Alloactinosynnema sp. L-07 TaxID=1653480 RepID=UPI0009EE99A2